MQGKLLYELYEYRLARSLNPDQTPRHIGVILDGNRRWAKAFGAEAAEGHKAGASKVLEFLTWAQDIGTEVVTLWLLSTDNLSRAPEELSELMQIITALVEDLVNTQQYRVQIVGDLKLLPPEVSTKLRELTESTWGLKDVIQVNVAVGYGGRQELVDAVRGVLEEGAKQGKSVEEIAAALNADDITAHLYTRGQPDPELIIRTSGEQRLSGFLMWQSAHSEYYFCETFWPDFRRVDFLRALRAYTQRERRMGR